MVFKLLLKQTIGFTKLCLPKIYVLISDYLHVTARFHKTFTATICFEKILLSTETDNISPLRLIIYNYSSRSQAVCYFIDSSRTMATAVRGQILSGTDIAR